MWLHTLCKPHKNCITVVTPLPCVIFCARGTDDINRAHVNAFALMVKDITLDGFVVIQVFNILNLYNNTELFSLAYCQREGIFKT